MSKVTVLTRELRRNETKAEREMWKHLRNRKLCGRKFLRQHPIPVLLEGQKRYYIADFYCSEAKLIIEIDGDIHQSQQDYDDDRTDVVNSLGISVLRFKNEEVMNEIPKVLDRIKKGL